MTPKRSAAPGASAVDGAASTVVAEHVQRHVLPFFSLADIAAMLADIGGAPDSSAAAGGSPLDTLNRLFRAAPRLFETSELRVLDDEIAMFESLARGRHRIGPAHYRIVQTIHVAETALRDGCALSLFIPVPRYVPGVQRTRLVECSPARLRHHHVPRAGQMYGVGIIAEPGAAVPPLRMVFEVEQSLERLLEMRDQGLVLTERRVGPEERAAGEWLGPMRASDGAEPRVAALAARVSDELGFAFADPDASSVTSAIRDRLADVLTRTRLLAMCLREHGIATRVAAAQPLMLKDRQVHLRFPGSWGYGHSYLEWRDPSVADGAAGAAGVVDLNHVRRWGFAATTENTRSEAMRARLRHAGHLARSWLRRGVYPLDAMLSGHVPPSRLVDLDAGTSQPIAPPVTVELEAHRSGEAHV